MKLLNPYRDSRGGAPRDALSKATLLSGSPVLGRGVAVVAEADPLRLALPVRRGGPAAVVRDDHAAPERQSFHLAPPALPKSGSGHA